MEKGMMGGSATKKTKSAQSTVEHLSTYGWGILILIGIMAFMLIYTRSLYTTPSLCSFSEGFYCNGVILGVGTHQTVMVISITNYLKYAVMNPSLIVSLENNSITVPGACFPDYLLPGDSAQCEVPLSGDSNIKLGQYLTGDVYVKVDYCEPAISNCTNPSNKTYIGSIKTHATSLVSPSIGVMFTAENITNPSNPIKNTLHAQITLLGAPVKGAAVNFAVNNSNYTLNPTKALSDYLGNATSYIIRSKPGKVRITATYAGVSSSLVLDFPSSATTVTSTASSSSTSSTSSVSSLSSTSTTSTTITSTVSSFYTTSVSSVYTTSVSSISTSTSSTSSTVTSTTSVQTSTVTSTTSVSTVSTTSSSITSTTASTTTASTTVPTTVLPTLAIDLDPVYTCIPAPTGPLNTTFPQLGAVNCSSNVSTGDFVNVSWNVVNSPPITQCIVFVNGSNITSSISGSTGWTYAHAPIVTSRRATATELISVSCNGTINSIDWSDTQEDYAYAQVA